MSYANPTVTSANSDLFIFADGVDGIAGGIMIDGWASDGMWDAPGVQQVETRMTANGKLLGGFIYNESGLNITVEPTAQCIRFLDVLASAQRVQADAIPIRAQLRIKGTGRMYAMSNGFMTTVSQLPGAGKTLKAQSYEFKFGSITPEN